MGVFATRSPFRPNPLGLSCVRLREIRRDRALGPVLIVAGADLLDGTPIYDVKPYLPYADCRPDAVGGFAARPKEADLTVECQRCWTASRRTSGPPCWPCWPRTPGPSIRTTRNGSTVWPSPVWR